MLPAVNTVLDRKLTLSAEDRKAGSLPSQIKASAKRHKIELPDGWKASMAIRLVSTWAEKNTKLADEILDRAETLFATVQDRFTQMDTSQ